MSHQRSSHTKRKGFFHRPHTNHRTNPAARLPLSHAITDTFPAASNAPPPPPRLHESPTLSPAPTFDVDDGVAKLVLEHVDDPLTLFSLAAVSRMWRRAVKSASDTASTVWPKDVRLLVHLPLAAKLTDARVE